LNSTPDIKFYEAETDAGKWVEYADKYVSHEFNLLGSGWVKVYYGMKAKGFEGINYSDTGISYESVFDTIPDNHMERGRQLGALAKRIASGYEPIDWHIDFKSGYRTEIIYYTEIKYGVAEGFDAKVSHADVRRIRDVCRTQRFDTARRKDSTGRRCGMKDIYAFNLALFTRDVLN